MLSGMYGHKHYIAEQMSRFDRKVITRSQRNL